MDPLKHSTNLNECIEPGLDYNDFDDFGNYLRSYHGPTRIYLKFNNGIIHIPTECKYESIFVSTGNGLSSFLENSEFKRIYVWGGELDKIKNLTRKEKALISSDETFSEERRNEIFKIDASNGYILIACYS